MLEITAALLVGVGLAAMTVSLLGRARARQDELLELLELPYAEEDIDPNDLVGRVGLLAPAAGAFDDVLTQLDLIDRIADKLEKSRVPLRPGEFVLLTCMAAIAVGVWLALLTGVWATGLIGLLLTPPASVAFLDRRVRLRARAFEEQLPPTLGLIASSLRSGHTLLRSIDMMVEETPPPMSDEFERVLAETRLGLPLIDALDRMADRVALKDFEWTVHAIRVQQQTGGKLADLLFTLAEYMRAREEVRREVRVLTAEGRVSASILVALPFLVAGYLQMTNPEYFAEMFNPLGYMLLGTSAVFMAVGVFIILQMIKAVDL